jgi:hypothetical protein
VKYAPSSVAKAGVAASPALPPTLSGVLSHVFLLTFTSTSENNLQTAGLQDGAPHCSKILSSMYAALNSDPSDPDVIIVLDIFRTLDYKVRHIS